MGMGRKRILNRKTLGLKYPAALIGRADEVI
jgi:hypothetical protein